jgi:2-polyprenyl-6-hydroxyphenyl methylase/3-demethylubiquinone-9 3-methyltransferase
MSHSEEIKKGHRFEFGANWSRFLKLLDDEKICAAEGSLRSMLGVTSLEGKTFIDIGSGSGLLSLAAKRLGARVFSFDYDPKSVACTAELRRRYYPESSDWQVEEGSALDPDYLGKLGRHDIVYSWGVLHHTGEMWRALGNVAPLVRENGRLFVAIYNDQGWISNYWRCVKRFYNSNVLGKAGMVLLHTPYLLGLRFLVRALSGRLSVERGMSLWYDMLDWLGGYPFEVATPEQVILFYKYKGFVLENLKTTRGRHGCNEFVFISNQGG